MSVLVGKEIEKALKNKLIIIEPLDKSQVGPGSIDLTLGNDFRVFKKHAKVYHVKNDSQFQAISKFSLEEKKIIKEVLEGLILKHEAKRWSAGA